MDLLAEGLFQGNWKSFKVFRRTGEVRLNSAQQFRELRFAPTRTLTMLAHERSRAEEMWRSDNWSLEFKDKRHYLSIPQARMRLEVITINHTVLVLLDPATEEKTFYAREDSWEDRLKANKEMLL